MPPVLLLTSAWIKARWRRWGALHSQRVFTRLARRGGGERPASRTRAILANGLLGAAALALLFLLARRPLQLAREARSRVAAPWVDATNHPSQVMVDRLSGALVPPVDPATGSPGELEAWLAREPLVVAVEWAGGLWVREGQSLVLARDQDPKAATYRAMLREAQGRAREFYALDRDAWIQEAAFGALPGPHGAVLWEWRPGSPQVEAFLRQIMGPTPQVRTGLRVRGQAAPSQPQAWGKPPALQADPWHLNQASVQVPWLSTLFPRRWELVMIPTPEVAQGFRMAYWRALGWGALQSLLFASAAAYGIWVHYRVRRQAALDADRLANLTHSLKTPLAVLKMQCDTLRLGRMDPVEGRLELSRMGREVDKLTSLIDGALQTFRGGQGPDARPEVVTADWIRALAEELQPAVQGEGRSLRLELGAGEGWASLGALRTALLTLLENALIHGEGEVCLETAVVGRAFRVRVSDQGPGLDPIALANLGRPFQRMRKGSQEGYEHEGSGLGFHLLVLLAREEGWGLQADSTLGAGLTVTLWVGLRLPTSSAFREVDHG